MATRKPSFLGGFAITLMLIVVGVPTACLAMAGTSGTILVPVVVAAVATPFFLLHYVVWGRWLAKRVSDESHGGDKAGVPTPDPD
jgi:hypothetical protein